jgi:hypothetical protein
MAFEIKKISDYGTAHPVVARLKVQTHELIQWADISKDKRESVAAVYFEIADRLLKCHEIRARLVAALNKAVAEFRPSSDPRVMNVPHLIGLRGEVETFLYEAKNFLRDLLAIINPFFDTTFDDASAFYDAAGKDRGRIVVWATEACGDSDHFTAMLSSEQKWIEELIRKRNAVEHPGGRSGTLHIENFTPLTEGRFLLPRWHRDQSEALGLFPDLETYLDNLLTLAEDMLVSCIHHRTQHSIIQFVEIPPDDRDTACPMRLTVQIDKSKLKPPINAT